MIPYWMKCQVFLVISLRVGFINYVIICSRDGLVWPLGSEKNRRGHFLLTSFFCFKVAILFELSTLEDILLCNFYKNNKAKVTTEKIERKIWKCCLSFFLIMPVTRETDRAQGSQCESLRDTVESKYMGLPRDSQESSPTPQFNTFFGAQPSLWSNCHSHIWLLEKP